MDKLNKQHVLLLTYAFNKYRILSVGGDFKNVLHC
ncbi:hypothetical protein DFR58_101160 [Anaerobacterium chartisolvens]|uniref:Uncharacterized protein n=1 Tax=Anaerobacterium chartisolvens TaxID=1297424 RepID=A0A369BKF9_9FIRM|nr:hypothetical protein DFR58_101160 [Anaerobacterium chartisolvens]